MSNKQILVKAAEARKDLKVAYISSDLKKVNTVVKSFMVDCEKDNKVPAKYSDFKEYNYLTVSYGNTKLSSGFITLNVTAGLLCPMDLMRKCGNCAICYAKAGNKRHFKNTVPKNCINQIVLNRILLGEITLHEVLFNTFNRIFCDLTEANINNITALFNDLRVNVEGDILNQDILRLVDHIAGAFKEVFNLKTVYSYTHNKGLDLSEVKHINFNTSDFSKAGYNQFKAVDKLTFDLRQKIIKGELYLCLGDCSNCKYCKYNHGKVIIVLKHGSGYKGTTEEHKSFFNYIAGHNTDCEKVAII